MPTSGPGDPRALACRHCGSIRRYLHRVLVCDVCDATASWPTRPQGSTGPRRS